MTRALGSGVGAGYGRTTAAWGLAGKASTWPPRDLAAWEVAAMSVVTEHLGQRTDLPFGVAQQFPDFLGMTHRLGGDIDAVDKQELSGLDHLLFRGACIVLCDLDMA